MNVLLINNIASMQSITAESLNSIPNVKAICLSDNNHKYISKNKYTFNISNSIYSKNIFKYLYKTFRKYSIVIYYLIKSDVIHFCWGTSLSNNLDLKICKLLGKPIFVEFVGSDIRIPSVIKSINPYYKKVFDIGYEYKNLELENESEWRTKLFANYNAITMLSPEMFLQTKNVTFRKSHLLMQRVEVNALKIAYPSINNDVPLIVHSPTAQFASGTNYIVPVINELKKKYKFEFVFLNNLPRSEILKLIESCDIFLDSIILGGYGIASCEAMSMGKPTMCYIMPQLYENGLPLDCPIVNTNPANLEEKLIELITNPQLRNDIGKKSRTYAEKYHDGNLISLQLLNIYNSALKKKSSWIKTATNVVLTINPIFYNMSEYVLFF